MDFKTLFHFIDKKMKMSHIYQPVMIKILLKSKGKASISKIAEELLAHDQTQIEYYIDVTKNMVGKVLSKHKIVEKDGDFFYLNNFSKLSSSQVEKLYEICEKKLEDYIKKRGEKIWAHRRLSGPVPGSLRYEVLKRAKHRCELCGISAFEKSLDVDHILPKVKGGSNDLSNLQALCFTCNRSKNKNDDTDFRDLKDRYKHREQGCLFCELPKERIIEEDELSLVIEDKYPVSKHHTLIIPKRHILSYFDLGQSEINSISRQLKENQLKIKKMDKTVEAFNVGINVGETSGMTIFHCHIHLIPRRKGDVENPRGGVRGVIPSKREY